MYHFRFNQSSNQHTDCLTTGLRLHSNMSELAQVDYGNNDLPSVHSLWHCRQLCQRYKDCAWVSWRVANINDPENGQCQMMKILPANVQILAFTEVDQEWISSSMNCSTISDNFESKAMINYLHKSSCILHLFAFRAFDRTSLPLYLSKNNNN